MTASPAKRSVSMAACIAPMRPVPPVCPVSCFLHDRDGVVLTPRTLHRLRLLFLRLSVRLRRRNSPKVGNFGSRGKMDSAPIARADRRRTRRPPNTPNTGANRLAEGQAADLRRDGARPKSLLAGDGATIAEIYKERVMKRGYGSGMWAGRRLTRIRRPAMHGRRGWAAAAFVTRNGKVTGPCQALFQTSGRSARRSRAVRVRASRRRAAFVQADR